MVELVDWFSDIEDSKVRNFNRMVYMRTLQEQGVSGEDFDYYLDLIPNKDKLILILFSAKASQYGEEWVRKNLVENKGVYVE